jgi:hypothetical protein
LKKIIAAPSIPPLLYKWAIVIYRWATRERTLLFFQSFSHQENTSKLHKLSHRYKVDSTKNSSRSTKCYESSLSHSHTCNEMEENGRKISNFPFERVVEMEVSFSVISNVMTCEDFVSFELAESW